MFRFLAICLVVSGCAAGNIRQAKTPRGPSDSPAAVDAVKTPAKVSSIAEAPLSDDRIYFANIQLVLESHAVGNCEASNAHREQIVKDFTADSSVEGDVSVAGEAPRFSVFNVRVQMMGFDDAKFKFTSVDSQMPTGFPIPLVLKMREGDTIQFQLFEFVTRLRFDVAPIQSFTVEETRGTCRISHSVNLFAENFGRRNLKVK